MPAPEKIQRTANREAGYESQYLPGRRWTSALVRKLCGYFFFLWRLWWHPHQLRPETVPTVETIIDRMGQARTENQYRFRSCANVVWEKNARVTRRKGESSVSRDWTVLPGPIIKDGFRPNPTGLKKVSLDKCKSDYLQMGCLFLLGGCHGRS